MTFYKTVEMDEKYQFDSQKFVSNSVITVLASRRKKQLIGDGMHISAALIRACEEIPGFVFPDIAVFEASGEN